MLVIEGLYSLGRPVDKCMLFGESLLLFFEDEFVLVLYDILKNTIVEMRKAALWPQNCYRISSSRFLCVDVPSNQLQFYQINPRSPFIEKTQIMDIPDAVRSHIVIKNATRAFGFQDSEHFLLLLYSNTRSHFFLFASLDEFKIKTIHEQPESAELQVQPLDSVSKVALYYRHPRERVGIGHITYKVLDLLEGAVTTVEHPSTEGSQDSIFHIDRSEYVLLNSVQRRVPVIEHTKGSYLFAKEEGQPSKFAPLTKETSVKRMVCLDNSLFCLQLYAKGGQILKFIRLDRSEIYQSSRHQELLSIDNRKKIVAAITTRKEGRFLLCRRSSRREMAGFLVDNSKLPKTSGQAFARKVMTLLAGDFLQG